MKTAVGIAVRVELLAFLAAAMSACLGSPGIPCGSGYCPGGYTCHMDERCVPEPGCGNSVREPSRHEVCDDGNRSSGDGCSADCASNEICGNAFIDKALGEVCDDGNNNNGDGCSADCTSNETCGNSLVDQARGEVCDDGNNRDRDGCPASCKYDCENHDEMGYWVCYDTVSWQEARYACQLYGSDLVIIDDTSENIRVSDLASSDFWIGLSDMEQEGVFRWVDDSALSIDVLWAPAAPNDDYGYGRSEDCAQVIHAMNGRWNDLPCDMWLPFICESSGCIDCQCGDGQIRPGEECDDGNTSPGDGCDTTCRLELLPENEPNEDGSPEIGYSFEGNDFSTVNANGPYEAGTIIAATLEPAGDEDVFMVTNHGTDVIRVRFATHDAAAGRNAPCSWFVDTVLLVRDTSGAVLVANDDRDFDDFCSTVEHDIEPGQTVYAHVLDYADDNEIQEPGYWLSIDLL